MKISELSVSTFWKGEAGINAAVEDEGEHYKVKLHVKGSQVYDYSCSCVHGNSPKGMCGHARAVWETYRNRQESGEGKRVSTSQEVRTMIREYTNREVSRIILEEEEQRAVLLPRLILDGRELRLEFKVGRSRYYVLKNLMDFAAAVEHGAYVEYGKNFGFHHSVEAFEEESRPLVHFLMEQVNIYQEHFEQLRKNSFVSVPQLRSLCLGRVQREQFFKLMQGKALEIEDGRGICRPTEVTTELPELTVRLEKAGQDGIRVTLDGTWHSFEGERCLYVWDMEKMYCLSGDVLEALGVFFKELTTKQSGACELTVQDRDIPLFYERVLRKLTPYCHLEKKDVDLEEFKPPELKASFAFDSTSVNEISMRPTLSYGAYSFHPMEDEKLPRTVCRDVPGEFRISRVITKYFRYKTPESETLVIRGDDDALYRLLSEGMEEFMELGEVYLSEEAKKVRIIPPRQTEMGVRMENGWLEIHVDAGDLEPADFERILAAYRQKKNYYRLRRGDFLRLDDSGLLTISRLLGQLTEPGKKMENGVLRLPAYRALYLDSIWKEGQGIALYRDAHFKEMVRGMKAVEDSDFEIPDLLKSTLRGYQKLGYRWMRTLDHYGFGGILADDMGLGKTLQAIAVILAEKLERPGEQMTSLIVCPASLVYNWEKECRTFAPELKVCAVTGTAKEREELLSDDRAWDLLITSYDLLKRDAHLYQNRKFRFHMIDEAQYIKNAGTQSAKAVKAIASQTRFALTGTPVENRLEELWSIFDFLMPGLLFGYHRFKHDFELPIVKDEDSEALKTLRRLTGPFILRRLKQDVLKELPDKLETVVYAGFSEEQKKLYTARAWKLQEELKQTDAAGYQEDRMQILAELMRLRQICCDPSLCYENYQGGSAKLDTCMELIHTGVEGEHKILLFSQFASMLERIRKRLEKEGIACHILTGATSKEDRLKMVTDFERDEVPVFLISLKAGGTGLNLTAADIVIHYDPWWNVAAQNQATDRAHRIGQKKQVSVFKLIVRDTIEEGIMKLQEAKKNLADQVISGDMVSAAKLTREELLAILREE